jgi:ribonuclease HI
MCNTKLEETAKNDVIFDLIERAEIWLKANKYSTKILKWETKIWGEIPADFGRK